jgi:signal transduction histidine kinase
MTLGVIKPQDLTARILLYSLIGLVGLHWLCVVLVSLRASPSLTNVTSVLAMLEPGLVAALLFRLARLYSRPFQRAWRLMGVSYLFFIVGTFLNVNNLIKARPLSPSLADPFLIAGGLLMLVGLLALPRPATPRLQGVRLFIEVAIAVIVFATFFWRFAFAPQVVAQGASTLTITVQTLYILLNFTVFSVLLVLVAWTRSSKQTVVLCIGIGLFVFADLGLTRLTPSQNALLSLPWITALLALSYVISSWGTYLGLTQPYTLELIPPTSKYMRNLNRLPYLGIIGCYLLVLVPPPESQLVGFGVIVGVILITLIILLRQWVQLSDNEKLADELTLLSEHLEQRVAERSQELEESRSRLLASEKLASLGRLTAGLAHEINTPLAAAMHSLYQAKDLTREYKASLDSTTVTKEDHKEIAEELESSLSSAEMSLGRLGEFVRRMRSQTRVSSDSRTFYPSQLIRDVIAVLQPRAKELNITMGFFEPNESVTLFGDATRFSQVVSNLLVNALDACDDKTDGFVSVRLLSKNLLESEELLEGEEVWLEVHDNGVGIPKEMQAKIFEPMFTTKDIGSTGLGLAVVYDIVHGSFGGEIELESSPGEGTTFRVRLPLQTPQPKSEALGVG